MQYKANGKQTQRCTSQRAVNKPKNGSLAKVDMLSETCETKCNEFNARTDGNMVIIFKDSTSMFDDENKNAYDVHGASVNPTPMNAALTDAVTLSELTSTVASANASQNSGSMAGDQNSCRASSNRENHAGRDSKQAAKLRRENENTEYNNLKALLPIAPFDSSIDKASTIKLTICYLKLIKFFPHGECLSFPSHVCMLASRVMLTIDNEH